MFFGENLKIHKNLSRAFNDLITQGYTADKQNPYKEWLRQEGRCDTSLDYAIRHGPFFV